MPFVLVFDDVILGQLKKAGENAALRSLLSSMFDRMELLGPRAGQLVDTHLFLYEMKSKHPPVRLYFKHVIDTDELYVFEFEMKTSEKKQRRTIGRLHQKSIGLFRSPCQHG